MADPWSILAHVTRSGRVESVHFGRIAVCDASGQVLFSRGDIDQPTYMRSSAKPFQTMGSLELGSHQHFHWTDEEIAVITASHSAEPRHKSIVQGLLARAELSVDDLQCGPHMPIGDESRREMIRDGIQPTRLDNNCSGKHSAMIATCKFQGWDTNTYRSPDHPLQQRIEAVLVRFCGHESSRIPSGIDGCGVPSFYLSVREMAVAFARLANRTDEHASRVVDSMMTHPDLVAGDQRLDTTLMQFGKGAIVSKCGAEGLQCVGFTELGIGLCIKIADGSSRAHPAVLAAVGKHLASNLRWDDWIAQSSPYIANTLGQIVGEIEPAIG